MSIWSQYGKDTENKLMFSKFVDDSIGNELEQTILKSIDKKENGGAQLQYMAYANADVLGVTPKDMKNNPEKAMRLAITRNLGEIAYQEYNNAIKQGFDQKTAVARIDTMMQNMIPEFEKDPAMFIRSFAQSDKDGEAYVMLGQKPYSTSLTGYDLGSGSSAFIERMADSSIIVRQLSNAINGEPFSFRQSLKGAAIIDNLYGADPMLSKAMLTVADISGFAAGIAETAAVGYATGGLGTLAKFAIPTYQAVKGVQQSFTNSYGLRADPTLGELASESVFDFASTFIGMKYGQRIVDTSMALKLAPKAGAALSGLTKSALFNRYIGIGVGSAFLNPAFDMAVDYSTANVMEGIGLALPENTAMIYNSLAPEDLLKAYGKRVMMSFGASMGRKLRDVAFQNRKTPAEPLFGSLKYTEREFGDLISGEGYSPLAFNIGKYVAATAYTMSPGVLRDVDKMVRQNPNLIDPNQSSPSLIKNIMESAQDGASYRPIVISSILNVMRGQNAAYTSMADLDNYSFSVRSVAKVMFGMTNQEMDSGFRISQNQLSNVIDFGHNINDTQDQIKAVVNNENVTDVARDISNLILEISAHATPENKEAVAKDIAFLMNNSIISAKDFDHADRLKNDVVNELQKTVDQRIASGNGSVADAQNSISLANKVFTDLSTGQRFEDTNYSNRVNSIKERFLQGIFANYRIHDPNGVRTSNEMYEKTRTVANEFKEHNDQMAELKQNPLAKHNNTIQSMMETTVLDRAIADIDAALANTGVNSELSMLNGFLSLKKAVVNAAENNLVKYAETVVATTKNANIPDEVKHQALNETMNKFYVLMDIVGGSMNKTTMHNIEEIMKGVDPKIYDTNLIDFADGSKKSIRDVYSDVVSYNAHLTVSRNLVIDLAKRIGEKSGPYVQSVKMMHSRISDQFPGLTIGDLRRIINAESINGATLDTRDASGKFIDHEYTLVNRDGSRTAESRYSDSDITGIVETVLGKLGTDNKVSIADSESEVSTLAAMAAQRILDQELLSVSGRPGANGNPIGISGITQAEIDIAIAAANNRLRSLTGSDDVIIQGVRLASGNEMRDKLTLFVDINKIKGEGTYDRFIHNYFTVTESQRLGNAQRTNNPFVSNVLSNLNLPDDILIRDHDGNGRTLGISAIIDEYNLFKTADSVSTVVDATYMSMQFDYRNNPRILDMITRQIVNDSPKLYQDIKRTEIASAPQGTSDAIIEARVRARLNAIAATELRKTSIHLTNPVTTDIDLLHRMRIVEGIRKQYPGVDFVQTSFGRYQLVNLAHNGADMSSDQIEKLDAVLTNDAKMIRCGVSGAGHAAIYVLAPDYKGNTDVEQRELTMSMFDDYVNAGRTIGSTGKVDLYIRYDPRTNHIEFRDTWENGFRQIPSKVLNYEDILGEIRTEFQQHISGLSGQRKLELALLNIMGEIYQKLPRMAPTIQQPANKPVYGVDYESYYDRFENTFGAKTEQEIFDNAIALIPQAFNDIATIMKNAMSSSGSVTPNDLLFNIQKMISKARTMMDAGSITEQDIGNLTMALNGVLKSVTEIEDKRTMLRAISDPNSQYVNLTNDPDDLKQRLSEMTIYEAITKALNSRVTAQPMEEINRNVETMTDSDITNQLLLALMTRSSYFGYANQGEGVKRMNSAQLRSTLTQDAVSRIVRQFSPHGQTFTISIDGSSKTTAGGSIRDDGTTELPAVLLEALARELTGSPYSGQKLVNTYAGSNIKTQVGVSTDGRIRMSVHNLKSIGPLFVRQFFPNGVIGSEITLNRAQFEQFIAAFALHSTQQTNNINSEPNRQQVINPYVGSLYNLTIDAAGTQRKLEATYRTADERANALTSTYRNSGKAGKGQIVPIQFNKPVQLTTFGDGMITLLNTEEANGKAVYFGRTLSGDNEQYNTFNLHQLTFDDESRKATEPGLASAIELGIRNLYEMARSYYDSQSGEKPEPITRVMNQMGEHLQNKQFDANGNYADIAKDQFREYTGILMDYLADRKHLVKITVTENGKEVPLYFANFERNGLDGPHHSGPVLISGVRNTSRGYHFAGNAIWSRHQDADYDGDQAIWRAIDKDGVKEYVGVARGVTIDKKVTAESDLQLLKELAILDRDARYETYMLIDSSFESPESQKRLRSQPSQFQQIFGLLFATQFNKALPALDILENIGGGNLQSKLSEAIKRNIEIGKDVQMDVGTMESAVANVVAGFNAFRRNGYRKLVLTNYNKEGELFSNHYLGGMNMTNYMRKGNLTKIMPSVPGMEEMGDISMAVTTSKDGVKTFFVLENDGKAMFSKVIAAVKVTPNQAYGIGKTDKGITAMILKQMFTPKMDGAVNNEPGNRLERYAGRLKESTGFSAYSAHTIDGMRAGQPDEGIIKQFSSAGANAFKNVFQELFYSKYVKDGKLQSMQMTEDMNMAFAMARIASNVEIDTLDDEGFHSYSTFSNENKTHSRTMSREIPSIIKGMAEEALKTISKPMDILNAAYNGVLHTKEYTTKDVEEAMSFFRRGDPLKQSHQVRKLFAIMDEQKNQQRDLRDPSLRSHISLDAYMTIVNTDLPFYVKEQFDLDTRLMSVNNIMNIVDQFYQEVTVKGRLMQVANDLSTSPLLISLRQIADKPVTTKSDLIDNIMIEMKQYSNSMTLSRSEVNKIINDLGIDVSTTRKIVATSLGDPMQTGFMNFETLGRVTRSFKSMAKAALTKDKVGNYPVLMMNGKEATTDQVIHALNTAMLKDTNISRQPALRQVFTGLFKSIQENGQVLFLMGAEGLNAKDARILSNNLEGGSSWKINDPKGIMSLNKVSLFTGRENAKILSSVETDNSKRVLIDQRTGRRITEIGLGCI